MTSARYALVTGASRGIGSHFARALAARSWNLILVARTQDRLQQLARELSGTFGIQAETIVLDLTTPDAAAELARQIADRNIDVDLLVNNAGRGDRGRFANLPIEDQAQSIRLNTLALVELTHLLLPAMIARQRGAIINVSSTAGFQPMPYAAVYAATKAFVTNFSMALAEEVRADGITVVTLCPGPTQTESTSPGKSPSRLPGGRQPASEVVEEALSKIDAHGGLVIPRLLNKVMAFSNRLMPLQTSAKIVARAMGPQDKARS
jgi:short-subunit dehydrogenase